MSETETPGDHITLMPDEAAALIAGLYTLAGLCALRVALPQAVMLIRRWSDEDGLRMFRLKSTLLYGALAVALLRVFALWVDLAFFDQRFFGTPESRWPAEIVVAAMICVACVVAAALYHQTTHEGES